MHVLGDELELLGFVVDDRQPGGTVARIIGYAPQASPARLCLPGDKAAWLHDALLWVASRFRVDTAVLRSLLGFWIWGALLRRDLLCIPQTIFSFLDRFENQEVEWWSCVRLEVVALARVVPWMFADIGAPLCPLLFATDAQGTNDIDAGGYGIVARPAPLQLVRAVFERGSQVGLTVARLNGDQSGLRRPDKSAAPTVPFTLLPRELFDLDAWFVLDHGRWRHPDHVTLGESRGVIKLLDIVTRGVAFHRLRRLSLQDNRPTSGAMTKGRSPSAPLNYLMRRKTARALASAMRLGLPWVESINMPADESSRINAQ